MSNNSQIVTKRRQNVHQTLFPIATRYILLYSLSLTDINKTNHECSLINHLMFGIDTFINTSDRSLMVDPLNCFSFQPVFHDSCNKGCGMCYPVCGMVHIKQPLLLIGKGSPCGGSGFPLSLSELSFTICLTSYNGK